MIKRTLYFGNAAHLRTSHEQLVVELPDYERATAGVDLPAEAKGLLRPKPHMAPIEDLGMVVLDHGQITISAGLLAKLMEHNTAVVLCDGRHMPSGLLLPMEGHTLQSRVYRAQVGATEPLKKQLWQQTVMAKITNQAGLLGRRAGSGPDKLLLNLAAGVRSGDSENAEGRAAAYYWRQLMAEVPGYVRERDGLPPNNLLNYGYAIVRATVARALVGSGLLPTLGMHHRNQYNAYCLADDVMEPYRPYVDEVVCGLMDEHRGRGGAGAAPELGKEVKARLLGLPARDVVMARAPGRRVAERSPLMVAVERTAASLVRCYEGELRRIVYPVLE